MPEPIPIEKFRKAKRKVPDKDGPMEGDFDFIFERMSFFLSPVLKTLSVTCQHLAKLKCALVEHPEKILTAIRESVLPFLDKLPDPDETIAGAEVGSDMVCLGCLTAEEKAGFEDDESGVAPMTREEVNEYDFACERCGKPL